jgi:hypothetical protein
MRIENSNVDTTYFNKNNDKTEGVKDSSATPKNKESSNVIYAGDSNLNIDITGKKINAQKNALKTLMDQFENEKKTDDMVSELQDKQQLLSKEKKEYTDTLNSLDQSNKELMETYGITQDSQEQKDLKKSEEQNMALYLKSIENPDKMSEKDKEKLNNVFDSLTNYQKNAFHNDAMKEIWQKRSSDASDKILSINSTITGIKLEKLKTHPMVDAQEQAEGIIKDASKDIIGTLMNQAKDEVDKTTEENKEKIEKGQEEKDKKEQEAEKARQQDKIKQREEEILRSHTQNSSSNVSTQPATSVDTSISQVDQMQMLDNIKQIASKQNMTPDDIKGIVVDEQV